MEQQRLERGSKRARRTEKIRGRGRERRCGQGRGRGRGRGSITLRGKCAKDGSLTSSTSTVAPLKLSELGPPRLSPRCIRRTVPFRSTAASRSGPSLKLLRRRCGTAALDCRVGSPLASGEDALDGRGTGSGEFAPKCGSLLLNELNPSVTRVPTFEAMSPMSSTTSSTSSSSL
eukprot:5396941-Pleurochrysis_carterae.AAC.2